MFFPDAESTEEQYKKHSPWLALTARCRLDQLVHLFKRYFPFMKAVLNHNQHHISYTGYRLTSRGTDHAPRIITPRRRFEASIIVDGNRR